MFGLTSTLCVQLLNNTAGCRKSELKLDCLFWTGLTLRLGTNGKVMWKEQWIVGLHEMQGNSWRGEELLASQELQAVIQVIWLYQNRRREVR